ncbi:hypothetical protein CCGE531_19625 (plasmid) [Rhizobium sp. CCGE531]|nr:hypothetical protein CCGE531_19625 [Rhizobium sp. CCGE531]
MLFFARLRGTKSKSAFGGTGMSSNMSINSILRKIVSGSLMLVISGHTAVSMPIAAIVCAGQIAFASSAAAFPQAKRNAQGLLSDMRVSFGMIARSYKENSNARHRSAASFLEAVTRAARATQRLENALTTHNSKATAAATGSVSRAIGELQTRYSLTLAQNTQAAQGMRYLNAAWKTYSSRYILPEPANETKTVSRAGIRSLREKIAALEKRVASIEDQVADNAALRREVVRLRRDLAYYDSRPDDYRTYQSMLLTFTVVSGSFDALAYTTRVYYPAYYVYFEPVNPDFYVWRSYWDGYYEGYYEGRKSVWYDEPLVVDGPLVEITQIEVNQEINYQTIYNITDETRIEYEDLPQEILAEVDIPVVPEDVTFTTQALAQVEHDDASPQMDEAAQGIIEQPDEALGSQDGARLNMITPQGNEDHQGGQQLQDKSAEEEILPNNAQNDVRDQSGDLPQQDNDPSEENGSSSDQVPAAEGTPQQQMEPQPDDSVPTKCQEGLASC